MVSRLGIIVSSLLINKKKFENMGHISDHPAALVTQFCGR